MKHKGHCQECKAVHKKTVVWIQISWGVDPDTDTCTDILGVPTLDPLETSNMSSHINYT